MLYASLEPVTNLIPNADVAERISLVSSSLTPKIESIVLELRYADRDEKKIKKLKGDLREQLFHVATLENEKQVLPRKTMRLPVGFLNKIGMQENDYLSSRHPGWRKIESRKINDAGESDTEGQWIEYLLERDPASLPYSIEVVDPDGYTITAGRQVQQKSPEIDDRTLQKDLPEVFDKIMKPVVSYVVDVNKLQTLLGEKPELLPEIERHFAFPAPITKLASIKESPPDGN